MNIFREYHRHVASVLAGLQAAGQLPADLDVTRISVEPPREAAHGDLSTNAAMVLAKPAGKKPRELAEAIAAELRALPNVMRVDIAGPGFINLALTDAVWQRQIGTIINSGLNYGASTLGRGEKINVEYVSANPTGLLHVGHARGAVVGDALAAVLEKAGFAVTREYYINDAGNQVDILAESVWKRAQQLAGAVIPEREFDGLYPGEEVVDAAREIMARADWKQIESSPPDVRRERIRALAVDYMMLRIRADLADLGVTHAVFTSERGLVESGAVDAALKTLDDKGLIYTGILEPPKGKLPDDWEARPQTLFRATQFGDDVDRPLKKSDGGWTYFASDIAYHLDKFKRGFNTLIDVWGADHGGYVKRMQAAVKAITDGRGALDVKLCQLVNLMNRGEPVRMSKRAGNVITVRDVLDEVGKDVVRFIMLTRKNDAALEFDYAKVREQSKDNPVFYVQYAHARCNSVFRQAREALPTLDLSDANLASADVARLADAGELAIVRRLAGWPRVIEAAAEAHEPHRLAFYLNDIAADFHGHWNRGKEEAGLRYIVEGDAQLTRARLALVRAVQIVIASGLHIFGVTPVEEMR
ncbi:MAG: arginine--tRNA ligase [Alphaproteobacteria bacterium]